MPIQSAMERAAGYKLFNLSDCVNEWQRQKMQNE